MAAEVGQARAVRIQGCSHEVVGPIIRGDYQLTQMNHGKPAYKKEGGANQTLTVMIYFWDERDGASSSGWWIGPQIGGNMVWGHHPNRTSATPPTTGWQAPHSAPPDGTMSLIPIEASQVGQAPANGGQAQAQLQQQQQMLQLRQQQMQAQLQAQQAQAQNAQKAQWEAQMNQHRASAQQQQEQRKHELDQKRVEQQAIMAIRKVLMKLKSATPENFAELTQEVQQVVAAELEKCGSQALNIKTECERALMAAKEKVDQILDLKRKQEEQMKELAAKREEARQAALKLLNEFQAVVEEAESQEKALADTIKELTDRKDITTEAAVDKAMAQVEEESNAVLEKAGAAMEMFREKQNEMKLPPAPAPPPKRPEEKKEGDAAEEEKKEEEPEPPNLQLLSRRAFAVKAAIDRDIAGLKTLKVKFVRRVEANEVVKKQQSLFSKYDKNKDKCLDKKEITALAKGEYQFQMPDDALAQIEAIIVAGKGKGVKFEDFSRLLTAIGVAREQAKDNKRRDARLEREAELAEEKKKIQAAVDDVQTVIKEATDALNELLTTTRALPKDSKDMTAVKMVERAGELEEQVKALEEQAKAAQEKAEEFGKDEVDKDLDGFLKAEKMRLSAQAKKLDALVSSAKTGIENFRSQATKKDEAEVKGIAAKVVARLRAYQAAEKLSPQGIFEKIAGGGESFDKDTYVKFMAGVPKADESDDEEISEEAFARAFTILDEEKAGAVSCDTLVALLRKVMKVVSDIALTPNRSIEDATSLRRLEAGDAVEVLEGPVEEGELKRIRARCLSDGLEGWLSVSGTAGTVFLKEGGDTFKVIKETILTECFEIDATKESGKKGLTRKLKPGELLELRTWGKKQEESGLTRTKVKAKSDGLVGWVTTLGNTGIKFVEMV